MVKPQKKTYSNKRALIHKKFVNARVLALALSLCVLYLLLQITWIRKLPVYIIILINVPMLLIIWHRAYQILYDLKLLFFFDDQFDVKIDYPKDKELPAIAFIIPSYQEPFNVAKMTFDSVVNTRYSSKKEIIVVDNSAEKFADNFIKWKAYVENFNIVRLNKNVSAKFLYNEEKGTLKPGNLDMAQRFIEESEFVVFLDVDSTLPDTQDLLERAVAEFEADSRLGFIQFKIKSTNSHFNALTNSVSVSQDLLRLRMISRGYGGYKIFEGHNGIWRKSVLDELGTWTEYFRGKIIITEDILKSAHTYAKGYYGKPLNVETGEWVPSSLRALESMWLRWMYGNSQVFFKCFWKIYSKKTSLIEKFDISYHVTHHLVTLFFFVTAFLLQVLVPGPMANNFIILFGIVPQLISALTSYFTSVRKTELPIIKKLQHIYAGFFMIETFIMYTQIKSDIKFIFRVKQGWKVTEKGIENSTGWKSLILNNLFYVSIGIAGIGLCAISWIFNYGMTLNSLHYHFALLFVNINLLMCIVAFGKQGRRSHNNVESAIINSSNIKKSLETALINANFL